LLDGYQLVAPYQSAAVDVVVADSIGICDKWNDNVASSGVTVFTDGWFCL